jgi:topoisomerase-4 subunit A
MVQTVTLLPEHDDEDDVPDPEPDSVADTEILITPEDKTTTDEAPQAIIEPEPVTEPKPKVKAEPVVVKPEPTAEAQPEEAEENEPEPEAEAVKPTEEPTQPPPKKIDFEITNPDDIDIDDRGQLGLF